MPELAKPEARPDFDVEKLGRLTLEQLQELARSMGIDHVARRRKADLVQILTRVHELQALKLRQLQKLAAELGVEGAAALQKQHLIRKLATHAAVTDETAIRAGIHPRKEPAYALPLGLRLRRAMGWLLSLTGIAGGVFSLVLLVSLPSLTRAGSARLQSLLDAASIQVEAMVETIHMATDALDQTSRTLQDSRQAIEGVDLTLQDSQPLIESTGELLGERIPGTLEETRQALISAEAGAKAIDQVLRGLNSVRLITGVVYEPEQSLDQGLIAVADGLEPLPATLKRVEADLAVVGERFSEFRPTLRVASNDLAAMSVELSRVSTDLRAKGETLQELALLLEESADDLPQRRTMYTAALLVVTGWLVIGQVGLYFVGEWVRDSTRHPGAT